MGCSRDSNATNYHASPDIEVCFERDSLPDTTTFDCNTIELVEVQFSFNGDPEAMKSLVAFAGNSSTDNDNW